MEFLQELFVTAFLAVVISFIFAISIATAGSEEKKNYDNDKEKKMVGDGVKLDKRLKVKDGKSKKRVTFADDVVVNNVDHFDVAEKPIKDFELSEKLSEKVGWLDKLPPGVIFGEVSEEAKAIDMDDQIGGKGLVKESEVMPCEIVEECINVNTSRGAKGHDDEMRRGCKDIGLLDKVLGTEIVEPNTQASKADDFHRVGRRSEVVGALEDLDDVDKFMYDEIEVDSASELVKNGIGICPKGGDEAGGSGTNSSELLDEVLGGEAIEKNCERAEIYLDKSCVGGGLVGLAVDGENDVEVTLNGTAICQDKENEVMDVCASGVVQTEEVGFRKGNEVKKELVKDKNFNDDDDDDWEGVESSELEKMFAEAVHYVECVGKGKDDELANLGSDVQMQLYGLQRLALEGPCHEPQPMALKVSARAKWNAWQRLGSMSSEVAMEQYINLLSDTNPGWMQHSSADTGKSIGSKITSCSEADESFLLDIQAGAEDGRKLKLERGPVIDGNDLSSRGKSIKEISG